MERQRINRRDFIKIAAVSAAAAGTGSLVLQEGQAAPVSDPDRLRGEAANKVIIDYEPPLPHNYLDVMRTFNLGLWMQDEVPDEYKYDGVAYGARRKSFSVSTLHSGATIRRCELADNILAEHEAGLSRIMYRHMWKQDGGDVFYLLSQPEVYISQAPVLHDLGDPVKRSRLHIMSIVAIIAFSGKRPEAAGLNWFPRERDVYEKVLLYPHGNTRNARSLSHAIREGWVTA